MSNRQRKLSLKQRRFCDEYINSGNIEQSMLKAGYSKNYARHRNSYMLSNVVCKSYIDAKTAELAKKYEITFETQIKKLQAIYDRAELTDYNAAIAAVREQDKLAGLITEQVKDLTPELSKERRKELEEAAKAVKEDIKLKIRRSGQYEQVYKLRN